jgi:hypothetical protein
MDDSHNASPSFPRVHLAPPGAARVHQLQHMFQVAVACPNRDQPRQVPPRRGKSDQRTASGQHVVIWSDIQHLAASGNVCQEGGIAGYLEPWSGPPEGPQTICRFADVADELHPFKSAKYRKFSFSGIVDELTLARRSILSSSFIVEYMTSTRDERSSSLARMLMPTSSAFKTAKLKHVRFGEIWDEQCKRL